jgi:nucleoside-diphosphate-sugar epimerase
VDHQYKVKDIVQQVYNLIQPKSELLFDSSIIDKSPQFICGSSNKLKSLSKWVPDFSLEEGLNMTIKYFQQRV